MRVTLRMNGRDVGVSGLSGFGLSIGKQAYISIRQ